MNPSLKYPKMVAVPFFSWLKCKTHWWCDCDAEVDKNADKQKHDQDNKQSTKKNLEYSEGQNRCNVFGVVTNHLITQQVIILSV